MPGAGDSNANGDTKDGDAAPTPSGRSRRTAAVQNKAWSSLMPHHKDRDDVMDDATTHANTQTPVTTKAAQKATITPPTRGPGRGQATPKAAAAVSAVVKEEKSNAPTGGISAPTQSAPTGTTNTTTTTAPPTRGPPSGGPPPSGTTGGLLANIEKRTAQPVISPSKRLLVDDEELEAEDADLFPVPPETKAAGGASKRRGRPPRDPAKYEEWLQGGPSTAKKARHDEGLPHLDGRGSSSTDGGMDDGMEDDEGAGGPPALNAWRMRGAAASRGAGSARRPKDAYGDPEYRPGGGRRSRGGGAAGGTPSRRGRGAAGVGRGGGRGGGATGMGIMSGGASRSFPMSSGYEGVRRPPGGSPGRGGAMGPGARVSSVMMVRDGRAHVVSGVPKGAQIGMAPRLPSGGGMGVGRGAATMGGGGGAGLWREETAAPKFASAAAAASVLFAAERSIDKQSNETMRSAGPRVIPNSTVSEFNRIIELLMVENKRMETQIQEEQEFRSNHVRRIKQLESSLASMQKQLSVTTKAYQALSVQRLAEASRRDWTDDEWSFYLAWCRKTHSQPRMIFRDSIQLSETSTMPPRAQPGTILPTTTSFATKAPKEEKPSQQDKVKEQHEGSDGEEHEEAPGIRRERSVSGSNLSGAESDENEVPPALAPMQPRSMMSSGIGARPMGGRGGIVIGSNGGVRGGRALVGAGAGVGGMRGVMRTDPMGRAPPPMMGGEGGGAMERPPPLGGPAARMWMGDEEEYMEGEELMEQFVDEIDEEFEMDEEDDFFEMEQMGVIGAGSRRPPGVPIAPSGGASGPAPPAPSSAPTGEPDLD